MIAVTLAAPNRSEVALVPLDVSSRCIQACSVNVFDESWRAEDGGAGSSNRYPVTHATLFRRCGACKRCEALCDAPDFTHRLASVWRNWQWASATVLCGKRKQGALAMFAARALL